jgi:hypothetical protein
VYALPTVPTRDDLLPGDDVRERHQRRAAGGPKDEAAAEADGARLAAETRIAAVDASARPFSALIRRRRLAAANRAIR